MKPSRIAEFIRRMPKTDLHVHLDGSIRVDTLIDLAGETGVKLPSYSLDGLHKLVFKDQYASLVEYLEGFGYTVRVMQSAEALERVSYEFAWDNFNEGVRYFEVRFAPFLHVNDALSVEDVMKAVNKGLARAKRECNRKPEIVSGAEPPVNYGIIACGMRAIFPGMSPYFDMLLQVHRFSKPKRVFALASIELVQAMIRIRDTMGIPIVGLDIAGAEKGYPPDDHVEAFDLAHRNFLKKTVHAGEAYGPESIFQAITLLHADRIGHGFYLFSPGRITDDSITDKRAYVRQLAEFIADRRITIEVCLTSNMQTNPHLRKMSDHAFRKMNAARLSTTLCTDNRTVSKTTVTKEIGLAVRHFNLSRVELKDIVIYGFKRSFFPGSYADKREYVRQVIDYYEKLEKEYCPKPPA
ncbi:adenosine deaminase family protein [bacterium]|nr:adenosine deaminase family protein [bacterium]